jgi:hypothetical protein
MPDASALLSVPLKHEDGSVPAKIASSLHDHHIEVERPFVRTQNSPSDSFLKCAMLIVVILPPQSWSLLLICRSKEERNGCYVNCRFFEIRQPRRDWETIYLMLGRFKPDYRN